MVLQKSVLEGDRLALARLLTEIENDSSAGRKALNALFKHTGKAYLIGVTGATGTGKSTLVSQLALHYRKTAPSRVAIVAVDPTTFHGPLPTPARMRARAASAIMVS